MSRRLRCFDTWAALKIVVSSGTKSALFECTTLRFADCGRPSHLRRKEFAIA